MKGKSERLYLVTPSYREMLEEPSLHDIGSRLGEYASFLLC